jgi:hypothetical protein
MSKRCFFMVTALLAAALQASASNANDSITLVKPEKGRVSPAAARLCSA